jgi:hypothetical protein
VTSAIDRSLPVIAISLFRMLATARSATSETGDAVSPTSTLIPATAQPAPTAAVASTRTTTATETTEPTVDPTALDQMMQLVDVATAPDGLVYAAAAIGATSMDDSGEWRLSTSMNCLRGRGWRTDGRGG